MKIQSERGKTSLAVAIIASVCIVIYLFALVSSAIRIYFSIDQRRMTAEREFVNLADLASSAGVLGFMNQPFIETLNDALAASKTLEAIIISGPEGEYAFERQKDRSIRWVNNSPRFINRIDLSSQSLYMPLRIQGLRNVNIQAVAGSVDYAALSTILKETLLLILAGLILAFFTLLMETLLGKSDKTQVRSAEKKETASIQQEAISPEPVIGNKPAECLPPAKPAAPEKADGPKGLFSPRSNIGWEEYTADRLEAELHRCASSEQDLVFFIMEFRNLDSCFIKALANEAAAFFTSKDLLFEKGDRGISVIDPGSGIETGIAKSGEFHSRVMNKYSQMLQSNTDFCIGLTSRSGRLVNAERLLLEAGEALKRAMADPVSPILAFKSDPDKYRNYITSQNQRQS
jgi:hypothetical protein